MKKVFIQDKLKELGFDISDIVLGDFDAIGEVTAKKSRSRDNPLYRSAGCYFRPNYERGILLYHLVKRFEARRVFEIGFGRGYSSFCAAKAMCDMGLLDGKVFSVDVNIDEGHLKNLTQLFPREWFDKLFLMKGDAKAALSQLGDEKFDIVIIDGDHRRDAVLADWEIVKDRFTKLVIFDDYHVEGDPVGADIEVASVVDALDVDKELVLMDRRIFHDDRGVTDDKLGYGQVLVKHPQFDPNEFLSEW